MTLHFQTKSTKIETEKFENRAYVRSNDQYKRIMMLEIVKNWSAVHKFVFWIFQPVHSFTLFKMKTSAFVNLMKGIHLCTILPGFTQGDQY